MTMHKLLRHSLLTLTALLTAALAAAQSVTWKSSVEPLGGDAYRIVLEAAIPAGYHMYDMGPYEGGPTATTIVLTPGEGVQLDGPVEQLTKAHTYYDELFGMQIGTLSGKPRFAQKVHLATAKGTVAAQLEWMICNDSSCMPPDETELTIEIAASAAPAAPAKGEAVQSAPAATTPVKTTPVKAETTPAAATAQTAESAVQEPAQEAAPATVARPGSKRSRPPRPHRSRMPPAARGSGP